MPIVEEIRALLLEAMEEGRTQVDIASKAKIHPVALNRFRSEDRGLSVESLESLANALGRELTLKRKKKAKT